MTSAPSDPKAKPPLARVIDVGRTYGGVIALDDVTLELPRGELGGCLGRTGPASPP